MVAVFGAPVAHEDDALRAVKAAADLERALAPLRRHLAETDTIDLAIRVGMSSGEVVSSDAPTGILASGDALATAARIEQAAQPGEILLGPLTLALVRDAVRTEVVEAVVLRGKSGATRMHRLLEVTGGQGHRRHLDTPLIGRSAELVVLEDTLGRSISERSVELVTIVGSAGIGKSRLTEAFTAEASSAARVARGQCLPYGDGITYWPIAEILRELAGVELGDDRERVEARFAELLAGPH